MMDRAPHPVPDLRALLPTGSIHFVGIGGAGMCALAEAVARGGGRVTGCDLRPGSSVEPLRALGVEVHEGHAPEHVAEAAAVVASAALPEEHPELAAARARGIPLLKRAEALGAWVNAGTVVAAAGTHGKTTTTAMIAAVLAEAGLDPTGFVGGEVPAWGSHLRPGRDDLFVVEADEFDRSFLHLRPRIAVVTNLEADHLDTYGSLEGVRDGFRAFLRGVREEGCVAGCADDPGAASLLQGLPVRVVSYGTSAGSVIRAEAVEPRRDGQRFRVREEGRDRGWFTLPLPGLHNVRNALGAASAARALGVDWEAIGRALREFAGVRRRLQRLGEARGVLVLDDYAHHPTELRAALRALRSAHPHRRLVAVFQPHLFTRTRDFAEEFGEALTLADQVWLTAIYPAREEPIPGVDGPLVARHAREAGAADVRFHADLPTLPGALAGALRDGDLCVTLGAGSIEKVGPLLLERLAEADRADAAGEEVGHADA